MKKYNYYLAGPCDSEHRTTMMQIVKYLRDHGKTVYAPWEIHIENAWDYSQEEWAKLVFEADIAAINDSEMIIMISYGRVSSAGVNWENGYAYAKEIPVHIIQVNDEPTSLMTFWGCTNFINLNRQYSSLAHELDWIIENAPAEYHGKCKTVLT